MKWAGGLGTKTSPRPEVERLPAWDQGRAVLRVQADVTNRKKRKPAAAPTPDMRTGVQTSPQGSESVPETRVRRNRLSLERQRRQSDGAGVCPEQRAGS
jgi:hypothetical protein